MTPLVLGAAVWLTTGCSGEPLVPGAEVPEALKLSAGPDRPGVAWVFHADDCLTCGNPTRALRSLQQRYRDRVSLRAVTVADADDIVEGYLRGERLNYSLIHLDKGQYRNMFGSSPLPAIYVIYDNLIVGIWSDDGIQIFDGIAGDSATVAQVLDSLLHK